MEENEGESQTQRLQNKVDKLKTTQLLRDLPSHHLTPPNPKDDDPTRDIALVNVLSVSKRVQDKFIEIRGLLYDDKKKMFVQIRKAIMNSDGAFKFCCTLRSAEEIEWASYTEEELPQRLIHFFEENIPYFLFSPYDEYNLEPNDYDYVINNMQIFIDTSFHKARQGKFINTLGRTYGEDVLRKALDTSDSNQSKKKEGGFMEKYNPFKNM
jgi:hypothetical protein